jgi:hypothetical protein
VDAFSLGFVRKFRSFVYFLMTLTQFVVNRLSPVDFIAPVPQCHPLPAHGSTPTAAARVAVVFAVFQYFLIFFARFIDDNLEPLDFVVDGAHLHGCAGPHIDGTKFGAFANRVVQCLAILAYLNKESVVFCCCECNFASSHRKSVVFDVQCPIWWTLGICCDAFIRFFLMWPQKSRISRGKIPQSPKTHQNAI